MKSFVKYLPALLTSLVWGTTFVASKVVLSSGVTPLQLMFARFVLGYVALWLAYPHLGGFRPLSRELRFAGLGLCGGSLYFLCEYEALRYTSAVNVGIIVSTVPLVTYALMILLRRSVFSLRYALACLLALVGVALIVFNGSFVFRPQFLGDLLAILAVLLWAAYTILLDADNAETHPLLVSRRLFFYALLSLTPLLVISPSSVVSPLVFSSPALYPVIYLGLIASGACIWLWNVSVNVLGPSRTNAFLYLNTVIPVLASWLIFSSEVTRFHVFGSIFILAGLLLSQQDRRF